MKTYPVIFPGLTAFLCASVLGVVSAAAQEPVPVIEAPAAENLELAADDLEELVGPIALYPDALIALILPASTVSSDVVLAARFLKTGGSLTQIETQPWEDSVKGLAHYPDVVKWMDENLSWTQRLGEAYMVQPQAVMDAIQRARAMARSNGVLVDTPQQRVVVEDNYIRIIPAQPDVIYVPRYDPEIIYVQRPLHYYPDPWLSFGIGFGVGSWLSYDLDWRSRVIWVDPHHHRHWRHHRDWRHRPFPGRPGYVHRDSPWREWKPSHRHHSPRREIHRWRNHSVRPAPHHGAPRFDRDRWQRRNRDDHITGGGRPGVIRPGDNRSHRSGPDAVRREQWENRRRERDARTDVDRNFTGGSGRPGVVHPGQNAGRVSGPDADRRTQWENRRRERDAQSGTGRNGSGSFRRANPGSVTNHTTAATPQVSPQTQASPEPRVAPVQNPTLGQRGERQRGSRDGSVHRERDGRRFDRRANNPASASPTENRWHPPQMGTRPSGVAGQGERRRGPGERTFDRQSRPGQSGGHAGAVRQMPSHAVGSPPAHARPAVQQHREHRPARIAQPSAPAAVAAAPAAPARSPEVRQSRSEHGSRPAASYGGGGHHRGNGEGRSSRDRRAER